LQFQDISTDLEILEANMASAKRDAKSLATNDNDESMKNTFILWDGKLKELKGDAMSKLTQLRVQITLHYKSVFFT